MQTITTANFEVELIEASSVQPMLLDIWAEWCGPCKALGPVLEKLETDYAGRFGLGKLDADAEPEIASQLSQMFGVRSIPFCVLFKNGQPVDGFVGALPEREVRAFLDKHVAGEVEGDASADADASPDGADDVNRLDKLAAAVASAPDNQSARADYLRALLDDGLVAEARAAWDPVAKSVILEPRLSAAGLRLDALEALPTLRPQDELEAAIAADKRDFQARFDLAQRHYAERRHTEAMDALLEILMRQKAWNDELARKLYVSVLDAMSKPVVAPGKADAPVKGTLEVAGRFVSATSDPVVDGYRRKLSMALF